MLFYIPSCKDLANNISLPKGFATFNQYPGGEWHVQVHDDVQGKSVWVLAHTGVPADTTVQLILLCDALARAGAEIHLFITYMGYARQDTEVKGQALSAELMCKIFALCNPKTIHVLQLHNPLICFGRLTNHIPYSFFESCIDDESDSKKPWRADCVVAPDQGAALWAGPIAANHLRQLVCIEKQRKSPDRVGMKLQADVRGKHALIVDDMITTGSTVLDGAHLLFEHGALSVQVAATHGIFAGDARARLQESRIEKIYVTNSLPQPEGHDKITVVDVAPYIEDLMKE
jgi:ribose-phosphate pyrophosphokinase